MATYVYRCADHGLLELNRPMGSAPAQWSCPECSAPVVRVFTAPRLTLGSAVSRALIDSTEKSRDAPEVVAGPPPAGASASRSPARSTAAANPAMARLPRP